MELYKEILIQVLKNQELSVTFPNLKIDGAEIVEKECYKALRRLKDIIHDDSLSDGECFQKIEEIICCFEELGSSGGMRHDFG